MTPGSMFAHYRILERLGAGGMGVAHRALDTHLNRTVAIKVLPADAAAHPGRPVQLTSFSGPDVGDARWSPDGRWVYFKFPPAAGVPTSGGEETQVLDQGMQGGGAITSRGIFFFNLGAKPGPAVEPLDLSTRRRASVLELPEGTTLTTFGLIPALSPDAR
jgi:serine/threonine protein kinase